MVRSSCDDGRRAGQHHHPLAQVDGLVDVVGDEQDRHAESAATRRGPGPRGRPGSARRRPRTARPSAAPAARRRPRGRSPPAAACRRRAATGRRVRVPAARRVERLVHELARGRARPMPVCPQRQLDVVAARVIHGNRLRPYSWNTTAMPGGGPVTGAPSSSHLPGGRVEQPGDAPQQRGLAAAGRADQQTSSPSSTVNVRSRIASTARSCGVDLVQAVTRARVTSASLLSRYARPWCRPRSTRVPGEPEPRLDERNSSESETRGGRAG